MKDYQDTQSLGVIVGNRDIFPDQLAEEGGKKVLTIIKNLGFGVVTPFSEESGGGTVQTREDSKECARLFKENAEDVEGIVVVLPNFGDEKSIAEALRLSDLDVPVLVHAFPDEIGKMDRAHRRDSFCGKLSVCNNLNQYGIPFTDTRRHVEDPNSKEFKEDLNSFGKICRVANGLRNARPGVIGIRPNPFRTVRYSEKILEGEGISVEDISLMEVMERARGLDEKSPQVQDKLNQTKDSFSLDNMPQEAVVKTAKLAAVMSEWSEDNDLDATSFQCWPDIEKYYGITPCGAMSLMSESLMPSACESDVMGSLSMYALQLASDKPAALVDLNNNYGDNPDKFVVFHCSNFPKSFFEKGECELGYHEMQEVYGACSGRIAPGPVTLLRLSTDDRRGKIRSYVAEGEFTEDELETFGGYGVVKVERLQSLLRHIVGEGFEHHCAVVHGHVADALEEAIGNYLGWEIYRHKL